VVSPKFTCAGCEWTVCIFPCDRDGNVLYRLEAAFNEKTTVDFALSIRNSEAVSLLGLEFPQVSEHGVGGSISSRKLLNANKNRDGTFTIIVRILFQPDHPAVNPLPTLNKCISNLFNGEKSADVAFKVNDKVFYAH
jgi:hypothetical protein